MQIQAILLSLVILLSIAINSGTHNNAPSLASSQTIQTEQSGQIAAQAAKQDVARTEEKTIENKQPELKNPFIVFIGDVYLAVSQRAISLGKSLALAASSIGDNSAKDPVPAPNSTSTSDSTLISKPDIAEVQLKCDPSGYDFTNKAMLAKYIDDGIIFESNSENRWPIASITKLMTAVVALEKTDTGKEIKITEEIVNVEGLAGGFKVGESFKELDLIKAMLVASSNDAAEAIAENFEGGKQAFVDEMQKKATGLKMFQTTYLEPTGLSFINQSTAKDLSILMSYIYSEHPEILDISRQEEIRIIDLQSGKLKKILNIDKFAGQEDFVGGKTGFIDESGRNLIGVFDISGKMIVTVVLGANNSFDETSELKSLVQNCL
ncbi:MAG: serine hydrolase [Candidatus Paceibacterota bacterium]